MAGEVEADDFDIAKAVFDKLKDIPPERKKRILGWVAESLGVVVAPAAPAPAPHVTPPPPGFPPAAPAAPAGGTDIKTFVAAKAPKSDNQFAATVAYYYRFEAPPASRKNVITGDDLQEGARLAGRARLSNPRNTLNNAKAAGYLDSSAAGEFSINSVGENLVAMTLPGAAASTGNSRRGTKAAKKKTRR